jgi:hypothetical protein
VNPVPVVIVNRDRAAPLRLLLRFLLEAEGVRELVVADCDSDWPDTLKLYEEFRGRGVRVIPMRGNGTSPAVEELIARGVLQADEPAAISDPDLEPYPDTPADLLPRLAAILDAEPGVQKAGVSLPWDHVPEGHFLLPWMEYWEGRMWGKKIAGGLAYDAAVDTTFALYRRAEFFFLGPDAVGARAVRPACLRHVDWAVDPLHPGKEFTHYARRCLGGESRGSSTASLVAQYRADPAEVRAAIKRAAKKKDPSELFRLVVARRKEWR